MIQLKDVAVEEVLRRTNDRFFYDFAIKNNIKTVEELEDYINCHPNIKWDSLYEAINDIKRTIGLRNRVEREPEVFYPRDYKDDSLKYVDRLNNGGILLLSNPTKEFSTTYRSIENLSLEDIKRFLSLTNARGDNFFLYKSRKVGEKRIPRVLEAVNMYSDQVERQAELAKKRVNYFTFQQSAKKEIVEEEYDDIIEYLLTNTDELVWGELSDFQKSIIEGSMKNKKQIDRLVRGRMVDIVTNYTTKPELEGIAKGKYEPLHRLIKTPSSNKKV